MNNDIKQIDPNWLDKKLSLFDKFVKFTHLTFLYYIVDFYNTYSERVTRSIAFAKIGWLNYDFESQFLYKLMSFKLKRVLMILMAYSNHVEDKESINALVECIQICDRLFLEEYEDKYLDLHDEKWGKLEIKRSPIKKIDDQLSSRSVFSYRSKVKTKKDKAKESKEFNECYDKAKNDRDSDIDRLAQILKIYQPRWWD